MDLDQIEPWVPDRVETQIDVDTKKEVEVRIPGDFPTWGIRWVRILKLMQLDREVSMYFALGSHMESIRERIEKEAYKEYQKKAGTGARTGESAPNQSRTSKKGAAAPLNPTPFTIFCVMELGEEMTPKSLTYTRNGVKIPFEQQPADCRHPWACFSEPRNNGKKKWRTCMLCGTRWTRVCHVPEWVTSEIGQHAGESLHQMGYKHPEYIQWAKKEAKSGKECHVKFKFQCQFWEKLDELTQENPVFLGKKSHRQAAGHGIAMP